MGLSDRAKRHIAFYFSVALFFTLLPVVISYSLGYHIDGHSLKLYKTGVIYLKSDPSGAFIYLNGKLLPDFTPARIENLKPGTYRVEIKREKFYPWQRDVSVRPNMVTRAEDIVLFPINEEISRISTRETADFAVSERGALYYMTKGGLFRSNMDGSAMRRISSYSAWPEEITAKRFSPDGDKILYFNRNGAWVIYLNLAADLSKGTSQAAVEEILKSPSPIIDAFWYSDSKHVIFVTDREVNAAEVGGEGLGNVVTLYKFGKPPKDVYYDSPGDTLYFIDVKKPNGAEEAAYMYRLQLRQKFLDNLMRRLKKGFEVPGAE